MRAGASIGGAEVGVAVTAGVEAVSGAGAGSGIVEAAALEPPSLTITDLLDGTSLKSWVDFKSSTIRVMGGSAENKPARTPCTSP
jgi:hypothetical protein